MDIRKTVTVIEDILMDNAAPLPQPIRRVAQVAVVRNPLVERDDENLDELSRDGEDLGRFLAKRALEVVEREQIAGLGRGAIVGIDGEPEHGQAILYPRFAAAVRETLGVEGSAVLSEKLIAGPGAPLRVHLQPTERGIAEGGGIMEIRVPGSPNPDEILVALVVVGRNGARGR